MALRPEIRELARLLGAQAARDFLAAEAAALTENTHRNGAESDQEQRRREDQANETLPLSETPDAA